MPSTSRFALASLLLQSGCITCFTCEDGGETICSTGSKGDYCGDVEGEGAGGAYASSELTNVRPTNLDDCCCDVEGEWVIGYQFQRATWSCDSMAIERPFVPYSDYDYPEPEADYGMWGRGSSTYTLENARSLILSAGGAWNVTSSHIEIGTESGGVVRPSDLSGEYDVYPAFAFDAFNVVGLYDGESTHTGDGHPAFATTRCWKDTEVGAGSTSCTFVDCDIIVFTESEDGRPFNYSLEAEPTDDSAVSLVAVLTHEVGHALGFYDTEALTLDETVMYGSVTALPYAFSSVGVADELAAEFVYGE